ncbi:(d)CMP kinase [Aliikangiella marina]|uniref:(d)CMP kinase n=1 Tax=Aliikangiella marina TaxID=1712262 RepID=UPI0024827828|nr:(d)CMP kinase [Aliikangiella marina]
MTKNLITIDGPSGSGKGTITLMVAEKLGWHILDSGALYRVLGIAAQRHGIPLDQQEQITQLARNMDIQFVLNEKSGEIEPVFEGENVGLDIRTDEAGQAASQVAIIPSVRDALLARQRDFYREPGLVADGRDMGTIVFPEAPAKIFLTASAECRAERRYNQLKSKGVSANMRALLDSIKARDERDRTRSVAPLVPAEGAFVVDSSNLTIDQVMAQVIDFVVEKLPQLR